MKAAQLAARNSNQPNSVHASTNCARRNSALAVESLSLGFHATSTLILDRPTDSHLLKLSGCAPTWILLKATFPVSPRSDTGAQMIGANFNASILLLNANEGTKRNAMHNINVYNKLGQRQLNLNSAISKLIVFPKQWQNVRAN